MSMDVFLHGLNIPWTLSSPWVPLLWLLHGRYGRTTRGDVGIINRSWLKIVEWTEEESSHCEVRTRRCRGCRRRRRQRRASGWSSPRSPSSAWNIRARIVSDAWKLWNCRHFRILRLQFLSNFVINKLSISLYQFTCRTQWSPIHKTLFRLEGR